MLASIGVADGGLDKATWLRAASRCAVGLPAPAAAWRSPNPGLRAGGASQMGLSAELLSSQPTQSTLDHLAASHDGRPCLVRTLDWPREPAPLRCLPRG